MMDDQHVRERENATFICKVYPSNTALTWAVNGRELKDGKKYKITSTGDERQLVVKDAREEDAKTITAYLGDTNTEAQLFVEGLHFLKLSLF